MYTIWNGQIMESEKLLINDLEEIKSSVTVLSEVLKNAGLDWKDDRYNAFVAYLSDVTAPSRQIIGFLEKYTSSLNRFVSVSKS